eukprot:CAMPEP_0201690310 /NCGR_PEP_ID=MMETSP0578-20130828/3774_1 /ASSEMBLY_ACC=CAM_ASM_000663 /TAXON_ID=267565 /ORGANISM="Skeletonema grethea, Strain CCMP 1804" /LENGTH=239 /DNA_ID=CAMNT_0048175255 /DNA_START=109 /DNA_END=825 /DNA_ORIENTATION=+
MAKQQLLQQKSDKIRRYYYYCRHENIHRYDSSLKHHSKRRKLLYSGGGYLNFQYPSNNGSAVAASNNCGYNRVQQDAIIAPRRTRRPRDCNLYNHGKSPAAAAAAFVSNSNSHLKSSKSTALHLKFKTFEEMITHHHNTPLLIAFYAPWCGPCKLMKGEIHSIRHQLELFGPNVGEETSEEEEEEDCAVEDVIALSSVCLEDGYIEEQQNGTGGGGLSSSVVVKEDTQKILNDLLPSSS